MFYSDTKFRLTTYAVWKHKGTTMINLFGWGDGEGSGRPERLIELLYDGNSWHWSGKHLPPEPELGMTTQSMAVIEGSDKTYWSLMGRRPQVGMARHVALISDRHRGSILSGSLATLPCESVPG